MASSRLAAFIKNPPTDIVFIIGKNKCAFQENKIFLAAQSDVFKSMLYGDDCISHNSKIVISDIDTETFQIISSYSRCETVELTQKNVTKVRNAATKYKMYGLVSFCDEVFPKQMSSDDLVIEAQPLKKAMIEPFPHDLSNGIGGQLLRKSGWDGKSSLFAKNDAVEQSMKYGGKKQMDLLYKHNGVGYVKHAQSDTGIDNELWNAIEAILRRSKKPLNVLAIKNQIPAHFGQPNVKKMNFIMYQQLKKGNVSKHYYNKKPEWSLCSNEILQNEDNVDPPMPKKRKI